MEMDVVFFRQFFNDQGVDCVPAEYSETTPVVVAELCHEEAEEIFGASKIKNGSGNETAYLESMCVVLYPQIGKACVWLTL